MSDQQMIIAMLDKLAELEAQRDAIRLAVTDSAQAQRVLDEYEALQERIVDATRDVTTQIAGLRLAIEQSVLELGCTVSGSRLTAVWSKPRVTWDTKVLDGFALAHPEIVAARHVGQPTVSIRPNRRNSDA